MHTIPEPATPGEEAGASASPPPPSAGKKWGHHLRQVAIEAMLAAVVTAAAAYCAWTALRPLGNSLDSRFECLYGTFQPAIQLAANNGMVELPPEGSIPELDAYLEGTAPEFDTSLLADYPPDYWAPSPFGAMHFYLTHALSITYRLFGVSRWSVLVLCGFLHAISAAILYGIYRLGMGRALSLAGGLLSASSPVYLSMCSSLRDFGKAPWILAVILVLGVLVRFRHKGKWTLAYSALLGTLMGIGFGFRQDLLICLFPSLAVVLVCTRIDGSRPFFWRVGAATAMVLLFAALAQPVLKGMHADGGSVSSHTLTQGVAKRNEQTMGFGDASYEFNFIENDAFCHALVCSYAERAGSVKPTLGNHSPGYARAGRNMFRDILLLCPADQFSRGLAAITAVPKLLVSSWSEHPVYPNSRFDPLDRFERLHTPVSKTLFRISFVCLVLGLVFLGAHDIRVALGAAFLVACFGAYPSLLYVYRHAFHLSFIPYWFAGLCLSCLGQAARCTLARMRGQGTPEMGGASHVLRQLVRGVAFAAVCALFSLGLLGAMLPIQRGNMGRMIAQYNDAPLEPLAITQEGREDGTLMAVTRRIGKMRGEAALPRGETTSEYLVAVFRGHSNAVSVGIEYNDAFSTGFSESIVIPHADTVRYFFPVFECSWDKGYEVFQGLLIQEGQQDCFEGLYRVTNAHEFRLWPYVTLSDQHDEFTWHKTGPLEKALMGLGVSLRSGFGWSKAKALRGYVDLARRYPAHLPYTRRAFTLATQTGRLEEVIRVWNTVMVNDPQPLEEAASSLRSLNDNGVFTSTELRSMRHAFEDLWTLALKPAGPAEQALPLALGGASAAGKARAQAAVAAAPSSYLAQHALADLYMETEDFDGLEKEWRTALRSHPGRVAAHFWLGVALEHQGDLDGAIASYERALLLEPRAPRTKHALTRSLRAKAAILSRRGETDSSLRLAKRARTMWAKDPGPTLMEAQNLVKSGLTEEAKEAYHAIIELAPHGYIAYDALSELYVAAGDLSGLEAAWRNVIQQHPVWALPHFSLGLALERQDDLDGAIAAYNEALRLEPEAAGTRQAKARAMQAKAALLASDGKLEEAAEGNFPGSAAKE